MGMNNLEGANVPGVVSRTDNALVLTVYEVE